MSGPDHSPPVERFCPHCSHQVAPGGDEARVRCPACGEEHSRWELRFTPALPRHLLPLVASWGLSPALLLWTVAMLQAFSIPAKLQRALIAAVVLSAPLLLYTWSAFILRRWREPLWWAAAMPLALGMAFVNLIIAGVSSILMAR